MCVCGERERKGRALRDRKSSNLKTFMGHSSLVSLFARPHAVYIAKVTVL